MPLMNRKEKMKIWLLEEVCEGDSDCDRRLRDLIRTDKKLIQQINEFFIKGEMNSIKLTITDYINENHLIIRTCKACEKKNLISSDDLYESNCVACTQPLLKRQSRENQVTAKSTSKKSKGKKCMYCAAPIAPFSKIVCMTCYKLNSVSSIRFD